MCLYCHGTSKGIAPGKFMKETFGQFLTVCKGGSSGTSLFKG